MKLLTILFLGSSAQANILFQDDQLADKAYDTIRSRKAGGEVTIKTDYGTATMDGDSVLYYSLEAQNPAGRKP